jgi:hypothetical protein
MNTRAHAPSAPFRRTTLFALVALTQSLLIGAALADDDPNAVLARPHGGKVWVRGEPFPASEGAKLSAWLSEQKPGGTLTAAAKDAPWTIHYLAVFKKPAVKGPMTIQFFEKGDNKNIVDQYSTDNTLASVAFTGTYDLSVDSGFNKGHTYVIKVGQILKKKFVPYATAQISLK